MSLHIVLQQRSYKMYQQIKDDKNYVFDNQIKRLSDNAFIPFAIGNTDYQAFKKALQTGKNADGTAVSLEDANGTAMTSDQITTFLATLP
jgi:hypothetical protein